MGIEGGPGGRLVELRKWVKMEVRREQTQRETMATNQISIFFVCWRLSVQFNRIPVRYICQGKQLGAHVLLLLLLLLLFKNYYFIIIVFQKLVFHFFFLFLCLLVQ